MLTWLENNGGTICITLALIAVILWIIVNIVRDRKKGRLSCGCQCAHCALAGKCHKNG